MKAVVLDRPEDPPIPRHRGYVGDIISEYPYMRCFHNDLAAFIFRVDEKPIFDAFHCCCDIIFRPILWFGSREIEYVGRLVWHFGHEMKDITRSSPSQNGDFVMPTHVLAKGRFTCVSDLVDDDVDASGVGLSVDCLFDFLLPGVELDDEVLSDVGGVVTVRSSYSGVSFEYVGLESSDTCS